MEVERGVSWTHVYECVCFVCVQRRVVGEREREAYDLKNRKQKFAKASAVECVFITCGYDA